MIFIHEKQVFANEKVIDNGFWEVKNATTFPEVGQTITCVNYRGGRHPHIVNEKDEFEEGYWEGIITLYATEYSNQEYGWIDREGIFYRCGYMEHAFIAANCFNMTEVMAESRGYVKIYSDGGSKAWYCDRRLTQAQYNKLIELGFDDIDEDQIE